MSIKESISDLPTDPMEEYLRVLDILQDILTRYCKAGDHFYPKQNQEYRLACDHLVRVGYLKEVYAGVYAINVDVKKKEIKSAKAGGNRQPRIRNNTLNNPGDDKDDRREAQRVQ